MVLRRVYVSYVSLHVHHTCNCSQMVHEQLQQVLSDPAVPLAFGGHPMDCGDMSGGAKVC